MSAYDQIRAKVELQSAAFQTVTRSVSLLESVSRIGARRECEGLANDCALAGLYVEAGQQMAEVEERLGQVKALLAAAQAADGVVS